MVILANYDKELQTNKIHGVEIIVDDKLHVVLKNGNNIIIYSTTYII